LFTFTLRGLLQGILCDLAQIEQQERLPICNQYSSDPRMRQGTAQYGWQGLDHWHNVAGLNPQIYGRHEQCYCAAAGGNE
jgi:hypothetical protein